MSIRTFGARARLAITRVPGPTQELAARSRRRLPRRSTRAVSGTGKSRASPEFGYVSLVGDRTPPLDYRR